MGDHGRRICAALAAMALLAVVAPGAAGAATSKTYIVQMRLDPVVAHTGDVAGLSADAYADRLVARHRAVLEKVDGGKKLYDYVYAYNGFAAKLTEAEAAELERLPDVLAVTEDELRTADTSSTPRFLGLDQPGGLWAQLGGPTGAKKGRGAGEGIVVGAVDSGIWPQNRSFSDRDARGKLVYRSLRGFRGKCDSRETVGDGSWDANRCNKKLVAARHFSAGWGGDAAVKAARPWEFTSPRDYNGHGTHTASTAAGNHAVATTGPASVFGRVSGIAPRARIAVYKALWSTENGSTASGYVSDLVAAIDQAVADGVDVLNYSVAGTQTDFLDPVEVAFLYAADAGVFVAAAGGNSGPANGTVAHPGPWLTTVAAGTHDRRANGSVTLGDGTTFQGASAATKVGPRPLVDAAAAALPDAGSWQAARCYPASDNGGAPVLDPAKVAGKIVLCDEGDIPPADKSLAVEQAGGVGMILANTYPGSLRADLHLVPTVHIADRDREAVKAYAAQAGATATVNAATIGYDAPAPATAAFSSRGPLAAGGGDLLKPDVIAPGEDILAAAAPPASHGLDFGVFSGTSMAAPHVAGLGALLQDLHPHWTPMMIKSALMTSASDVIDGPGIDPGVIFRQGAGHVRPNRAADPGLVYDSGFDDWLAFLCGTTDALEPSTCDSLAESGHSLDPSDLNSASIAIGRLPDTQTVTRRVTNVGRRMARYTASTTGLDGFTVSVSPSSLMIAPGHTKAFTVTVTRTTAPPNRHYGGALTWSDGTHAVRSPIVVRTVRPPETRWVARAMHGGPTFDAATQTGHVQPQLPIRPGKTAGDGLGVGTAFAIKADGWYGSRAIRWDAGGWTELAGLGTDARGGFQSFVYATTPDGTAVGNAFEYVDDGSDRGNRPVRWDAGSRTAVELEGLGTDPSGTSFGSATAINAAGTIAGDVTKYLADGTDVGRRAVRWDAGGTAATELGTLAPGVTYNYAVAINRGGDVVGYGTKRDGDRFLGTRAIRWAAGATEATELGVLGVEADGSGYAEALDINDSGTAIGHASRYVDGLGRGQAAVRWEAGGTAAAELDTLGTDADGFASATAYAINDAGTTVGSSEKHDESGKALGTRAVRWDAGGTAVTELEQLELDPEGRARSTAVDVNAAGVIVGSAFSYTDDRPWLPGDRAVVWTPDGSLVDLTSLLPPESGWTLARALSISDTNWITGIGFYDPDGGGDVQPYYRMFLIQVAPAARP